LIPPQRKTASVPLAPPLVGGIFAVSWHPLIDEKYAATKKKDGFSWREVIKYVGIDCFGGGWKDTLSGLRQKTHARAVVKANDQKEKASPRKIETLLPSLLAGNP